MSGDDSYRTAREVMQRAKRGVLSTLSREAGYPFGSVVPFCLDRTGRPVILIAGIAEHTRNILADPRVCLTVFEEGAEDLQESARVSVVADAGRLEDDEDAAARYVRHYPRSRDYHRTHDFDYYRLTPVRVRFIGGFGRIHWLRPEQFVRPNPFAAPLEAGILEHMNRDHAAAMRHYARAFGGAEPGDAEVAMAGIDGEGFDLLIGRRLLRVAFERPVTTPGEAREALVAMARAPLPEGAAAQPVQ